MPSSCIYTNLKINKRYRRFKRLWRKGRPCTRVGAKIIRSGYSLLQYVFHANILLYEDL